MSLDIRIQAEVSKEDPGTCKFSVDHVVLAEGCVRFSDPAKATASPLASRILAIPQISGVDIYGKTVMVRKQGIDSWRVAGPLIGAAIREHLRSGQPAVNPEAFRNREQEDKLRADIVRILDQQINPEVVKHNGAISLLDVHEGTVFLQMSGGCQGCASASLTLRQGVERTLRQQLPTVTSVVDVSDHAAGTNPYYAHA